MCNHSYKKYGWFKTLSGPIQRLQCRICGRTQALYPDGYRSMNWIPRKTENKVVRGLRAGRSLHQMMRETGIHIMTAQRIARTNGIKTPQHRKWATTPTVERARDRKEYFRNYKMNQKMTQTQRKRWQEKLRASISLWLAKSDVPLTNEQIYQAMLPSFPELKRCALSFMLNYNAEHVFVKNKSGKWTYHPGKYSFPLVAESDVPERYLARAMWFDKRGLKDEFVERQIQNMQKRQNDFVKETQQNAIISVQPQLRLLATAGAISKLKHQTPNEENNGSSAVGSEH